MLINKFIKHQTDAGTSGGATGTQTETVANVSTNTTQTQQATTSTNNQTAVAQNTNQQQNTVQQPTEPMVPVSEVSKLFEQMWNQKKAEDAAAQDLLLKQSSLQRIESDANIKNLLVASGIDINNVSGAVLNGYINIASNKIANLSQNNTSNPHGGFSGVNPTSGRLTIMTEEEMMNQLLKGDK